MYQFSDSDSSDSDAGLRFKTDSTRNKKVKRRSPTSSRSSSRRSSPRHSHDRRRHRSRSKSKTRRHRSKRPASTDRPTSRRDKFGTNSRSNSRDRNKYDRSKSKDDYNKKRIDEEKRHKMKEPSAEKIKSARSTKRNIEETPSELKATTSLPTINKIDGEFSDINSSSDELLGPSLPPKPLKKLRINVSAKSSTKEILGPILPPVLLEKDDTKSESVIPPNIEADSTTDVDILGPSLPPHLIKQKTSTNMQVIKDEKESIDDILGPSLPPHLITKTEEVGTELSPDLIRNCTETSASENAERYIGPTLPLHIRKQLEESGNTDVLIENVADENEDDDEDTYGPLPVDMILNSKTHIALEERALQLKLDKLTPKDNKTVREEWMIELPTVQASNLGLGPRQFRAKAGPDLTDRTAWTDTPEAKANKPEEKIDVKKEAELMEIRKRDEIQEQMSKKHKKKRDKSLLDIHQDKLKKKKKKEEADGNARKPFNRETDMKVNQFDDAQKKAIYKKAQFLDDRFSKGQSKFL